MFALEALKNSGCHEYKRVDVYKTRREEIQRSLGLQV
jgi:hypothetical protein